MRDFIKVTDTSAASAERYLEGIRAKIRTGEIDAQTVPKVSTVELVQVESKDAKRAIEELFRVNAISYCRETAWREDRWLYSINSGAFDEAVSAIRANADVLFERATVMDYVFYFQLRSGARKVA